MKLYANFFKFEAEIEPFLRERIREVPSLYALP